MAKAKNRVEHKLRMRARKAKRQQWAIDLENERQAIEEFYARMQIHDETIDYPIPKE